MGLALFFLAFFFFLALGVPIAFVLGLSSIAYMYIEGQTHLLIVVPQRMVQGVNSFTLLAIPFFMLAGELMNKGGITRRLMEFAQSVLGHFHGGLAYVNILVSAFLSSIIGSANAVAAITSSSIVPEMRKRGYSNLSASAVSSAAATMGPIIPPSIVLILYGVASGSSIGALFLAGIIPGLIMAVGFMFVAFLASRKEAEIELISRASFKEIIQSTAKALPPLSIPLIILGGIISGIFTPTESGAIACVVAFILGKFVYGEISWNEVPEVALRAAVVTAGVLFIASSAALFGWVMAVESVPSMVAKWMLSLSENRWIILLMITGILLVIGLFLEPLAAILVTVPVLLPVATQLGIDPIQFGIIISFNLVIGLITPPVGLVLFIVSGITNVSVVSLSKALLPYYVCSLIILIIIISIPEVTLFIPTLFSS